MIYHYQFLIYHFVAFNLLLQILAATTQKPTAAAFKASTNSTSPQPKQTSYFYRDPQGPGTYEFGYRIEDEATGNIQFRKENGYANGTIAGSFGYLRPDGKMTVTHYVADENGYRKKTKITKYPSPPTTTATTTTPPSTTAETPGLNLAVGTLPPQLIEDVMNQFQIDLSPNANPSDILHPNISDIINGRVPLKRNENSSQLGFEVVHNFIPNDFPIVSFQLPTEPPIEPDDD